MKFLAVKILSVLVLPPGGNVVAGLAGLLLLRRARRLGIALMAIAAGSLWLLCTPVVADGLEQVVQSIMPVSALKLDDPRLRHADVIVVFSGGRRPAPEYGGETVSRISLARLRYAAWLHRKTGLPLLVSGGSVFGQPVTEAELIRRVLVHEFGVPVRWMETRSRNTEENARDTAKILRANGLHGVVLVEQALDMPRAVEAFARHGITVTPAPIDVPSGVTDWTDPFIWLPSARALMRNAHALHELLGRVWYRIRY